MPRTEPVLLVHGFASSFRRNWVEPGWVALLEDAGRQVIGVDLLGHGESPKPHEPEAYTAMERLVAEAIPAGPVDAVAFSMGARILLSIAAEQPGRFGRIVVGGVGANLFATADASPVADAVARGETDSDQPLARAFARFAATPGNDPLALAACLRRPAPPLTKELLSGVTVPVLVVLGDRDFAGPADPLMDALPDARLVTLKGGDHLGAPEDFRFIDAALEFLEAVPA